MRVLSLGQLGDLTGGEDNLDLARRELVPTDRVLLVLTGVGHSELASEVSATGTPSISSRVSPASIRS